MSSTFDVFHDPQDTFKLYDLPSLVPPVGEIRFCSFSSHVHLAHLENDSRHK